ncbi:MAG: hypothetical protein NUV54_02805 [Candidatus Taylorbacteria bacterium]|nr:hypothetical protein [Candidatus Taylorbacteria bacterium]
MNINCASWGEHFTQPGKCPECGGDLLSVVASEGVEMDFDDEDLWKGQGDTEE